MKVLAVVAHADDEVLGCGGALCKHADEGAEVYVLILADGESSRDEGANGSSIKKREHMANEAGQIMGVREVSFHQFPDNQMDSVSRLEIIKVVEKNMYNLNPTIVYTHHSSDLNVDHRRVNEAVVTVCRPCPGLSVQTLLFFEVASSTEWQISQNSMFCPNWFTDISSTIERKMQALKVYDGEMRSWPHARSYEALHHLTRWRGATVGLEAAEAFMLGRKINR